MASEERIRELAHQIWESEGRPDGRKEQHWDLACELAEADIDIEAPEVKQPNPLGPIEQLEPIEPDNF